MIEKFEVKKMIDFKMPLDGLPKAFNGASLCRRFLSQIVISSPLSLEAEFHYGRSKIKGRKEKGEWLTVDEIVIQGEFMESFLNEMFIPLLLRTKGVFLAMVHYRDASNDYAIHAINGSVSINCCDGGQDE